MYAWLVPTEIPIRRSPTLLLGESGVPVSAYSSHLRRFDQPPRDPALPALLIWLLGLALLLPPHIGAVSGAPVPTPSRVQVVRALDDPLLQLNAVAEVVPHMQALRVLAVGELSGVCVKSAVWDLGPIAETICLRNLPQ